MTRPLTPPSPMQARILRVLRERPVGASTEELASAVYGETRPPQWAATIRRQIRRLRLERGISVLREERYRLPERRP